MNIKNAFRYQNFLSDVQRTALAKLLSVKSKQTETHMRTQSAPTATDEVKDVENLDIAAGITADKCISLVFDIFDEKQALDKAIAEAKKNSEFDFDAELNINKTRRELVSALKPYLGLTNTEKTGRASDYIFNAEGNQVSYSYPVKVVTELTFDKASLTEKVKTLSKDADDISDIADKFLLDTDLAFEPKFDIHDKFEDIIATY